MTDLTFHEGFWWAQGSDNTPHGRRARLRVAEKAAERIARLVKRRNDGKARVVAQAGGWIGLWPYFLSRHFKSVYTFEPTAVNFAALRRNTQSIPNIQSFNVALGDSNETASLVNKTGFSGMWTLTKEPGPVTVMTVDACGLPRLDALVLDVEGSELNALKGAEQIILAHRPVIWLEGIRHVDAIKEWLHERGYGTAEPGYKRDLYFIPRREPKR